MQYLVIAPAASHVRMKPALKKLRGQIRQCEEFIALCERIKHLEKLQDGRLESKKIKIETERSEVLNQLHLVCGELERLEESLNNQVRLIGAFEEDQLKALMKTARVRIGSLRLSVDNLTKQIESIDDEIRNTAQQLQAMYPVLEDYIVADGFDPDTIEEKLAELRLEKESLTEAMKADVSTRATPDQRQQNRTEKQPPGDGISVHETEFYEGLLDDFAKAKSSVEIVSPYLTTQRTREMMVELARLAEKALNVVVYTSPPDEQNADIQSDFRNIIIDAHRLRISFVQRSGLQYNVAIIDNVICWEGSISILGSSRQQDTMRRTVASSYVRELRHFLFNE